MENSSPQVPSTQQDPARQRYSYPQPMGQPIQLSQVSNNNSTSQPPHVVQIIQPAQQIYDKSKITCPSCSSVKYQIINERTGILQCDFCQTQWVDNRVSSPLTTAEAMLTQHENQRQDQKAAAEKSQRLLQLIFLIPIALVQVLSIWFGIWSIGYMNNTGSDGLGTWFTGLLLNLAILLLCSWFIFSKGTRKKIKDKFAK